MKKNSYNLNDEFVVKEGTTLLEFLLDNIKNKSKNNIKSNLARGNVIIGDKSTTKYDYKLKVGQKVLVKWAFIQGNEKNKDLDVIYEDDQIIAINKPSGLLSVSTEGEKTNTAYHLVMNYLKNKNSKNRIFVIHRLDKDTSGVLLFAKNEKIKFHLQNNWDELTVRRCYVAIVEGKLDKKSGTIKSWLNENKNLIVYSSNKKDNGKLAVTNYQVLKENDRYSLLDVKIDTGRKNQIRVHMKDLGHSVVGDKKYGSSTDPLKRLGLHANILEIKLPYMKNPVVFEADMPTNFKNIFKKDKQK